MAERSLRLGGGIGIHYSFWKLSAPCVIALVLMFSWGDVTKVWRHFKGRNLSQQIHQVRFCFLIVSTQKHGH